MIAPQSEVPMRPLTLLAAAIPLALGCAQQSRTLPANVATDQGLQVHLQRPTGGGLTYALTEPAYVAIFAIARTGGVSLLYPTLESDVHLASRAGANQLTLSGLTTASQYRLDRRVEERGIFSIDEA